jgi:hypothetical protein
VLGLKAYVAASVRRYNEGMNKTAFAVVLALAAPVSAQEYRQQQAQAAGAAYQNLQAQSAAMRAGAASRANGRALDATLVAMNDGVEAGGRVTRYLDEKKIDVLLATQAEPVKRGVVNGREAILLSDALPAHPRVYAPLIALEAAKGIYTDMPACGERSYMIMATAARAFAELGGEFKALPTIDGDKVDSVKDAIYLWTFGAETALDELARRDGVPTLPDLQAQTKDPKAAATLNVENSRFTSFLLDERDARREALLR